MQDKTHLVDEITGHRRMRRNRKADWTRRMVQETRQDMERLIAQLRAMENVDQKQLERAVQSSRDAMRKTERLALAARTERELMDLARRHQRLEVQAIRQRDLMRAAIASGSQTVPARSGRKPVFGGRP